jgi:Asp-tRNA(Asn)/Glu-tRNA(Gln) amidotransferase A subunit family amidase
MTRTVEDAVRILEVIAGYDPADPITERCMGRIPENYTQYLDEDGLRGARIGVFRTYIDTETTDSRVKDLMERAIEAMAGLGAVIIDPFEIPRFDSLTEHLWCNTFRHDVNAYLASLGDTAPVKNLEAVYASGMYAPYVKSRIERALREQTPPEQRKPPCTDLYSTPRNIALREAVLAAMNEHALDAIVFPTWSNPPRRVGDMESPAGDNSQILSPHTGFPAITVPMGMTADTLPAGLQFVGRPFGEPDLIRFAFAFEQATKHRRPPRGFPPLRSRE